MDLSSRDVLAMRMSALLLRGGMQSSVGEVVTWFGAMQAQDLGSGLWSFGVRLPHLTRVDIEAALERKEALRTWPMRGTVHFVPPRDARWMVEILGERPLAGGAKRREHLGLSDATADRAVDVLAAALAGGRRLSRAQCVEAMRAAGLKVEAQVAYHLLWYASQRGVTCITPHVDGEQTFALLDEWVPDPNMPERDEALGIIAHRYFRSHGPTTRADFAGWTGLTAADIRTAIAVAGEQLSRVVVSGTDMYMRADAEPVPPLPVTDVLALPGFDEYMLGFKDRSLMLADEHKNAIVPGGNGIFQSTIVRAGRVVGTWKRTTARTRILVDAYPLAALTKADRSRVARALLSYARYLGSAIEVQWVDDVAGGTVAIR